MASKGAGEKGGGIVPPAPTGLAKKKPKQTTTNANNGILYQPLPQVNFHPGIATGPGGLGNQDLNTALKTLLGL